MKTAYYAFIAPTLQRLTWILVAGLVLLPGWLSIAHAGEAENGTSYVSFWSGDLRIFAQYDNTQVLLTDLDTGAPLSLTDVRIDQLNVTSNPFVLNNAGDSFEGIGGLGDSQQEIRVRIETSDPSGLGSAKPVTVWTGLLNNSRRHPQDPPPHNNAWMSYLPAYSDQARSNGRELGREFLGFTTRDLYIIARREVQDTQIVIEDLITNTDADNDDSQILTKSSPKLYQDNEIEVFYLNQFEDDTLRITSNVDVSVMVGTAAHSSTDWTVTPPSYADGDEGIELGTEFYAYVNSSLTIFPVHDDTKVTITDLSDGDDSKSLHFIHGDTQGDYELYTPTLASDSHYDIVARALAPTVTIGHNSYNHFDQDVVKVVSDKPVLLYVGPVGSNIREFADVAFSVPTGPQSRIQYVFAQNGGASNDLQIFAFDPDTQVTITSLSYTDRFHNDGHHDFIIGPGFSDTATTRGWKHGTAGGDVWWGDEIWNAEILRIESNKPVTVISGDYDDYYFGSFIPYVLNSATLPPVAAAGPDRQVVARTAVAFDASGSFDQDANVGASVPTYHWDFDIAIDSDGDGDPRNDIDAQGVQVEHRFAQPMGELGHVVVQLTYTDDEGEWDTDVVAVQVSVNANQAPSGIAQSLQTAGGTPLDFVLNGSDPEGDPLSYRVVRAPQNGVLTGQAPNLRYVPNAGFAGLDAVQFVANDGLGDSAPATVLIAVSQAPATIADLGPVTCRAKYTMMGVVWSLFDGATSYRIVEYVNGQAREAGEVTGYVYADQTLVIGTTYTYTVHALDASGQEIARGGPCADTARLRFNIRNQAPRIQSSAITVASVGVAYQYAVLGLDPDNSAALTYSLPTAPQGMSIDAQTGLIQWTPTASDVGEHIVTVRVKDQERYGLQSYRLHVASVNQAPLITSTPLLNGQEYSRYYYQIQASDPNSQDLLQFDLVSAPSGMRIDALSGVVEWTPGSGQFGSFPVQVRVQDSQGGQALQDFTIEVANVPDIPYFTSTPVTETEQYGRYRYELTAQDADPNAVLTFKRVSVPSRMELRGNVLTWHPHNDQVGANTVVLEVRDETGRFSLQSFVLNVSNINDTPFINGIPSTSILSNQPYHYTVIAYDIDVGDVISFSLTSAPEGMYIDAESGQLDWPVSALQVGVHRIVVRATDLAGGFTEYAYFLTVIQANRAPFFTSTPAAETIVDTLYQTNVTATDPDSDPLTFSLITAPTGMSIDVTTGLIQWTPTSADLGNHPISVQADDGRGGSATQSYALAVLVQPNRAPIITSEPNTLASADQAYQSRVLANDPDGDPVTFALDTHPTGMRIDATSGVIDWTPTTADIGDHAVTIRASDNQGAFGLQTYNLNVSATASGVPQITSAPPFTAKVAVPYRYDVEATDDDPLTYSLVTAPNGMGIDPTTGLIGWTPTQSQVGQHAVTVQVQDATAFRQQHWTVTVVDASVILEAQVQVTPTAINLGETVTVLVLVTGAGGEVTATAQVDGTVISFDNQLQATVTPTTVGAHTVTVQISDGTDSASTESTFYVRDPSDLLPPDISISVPSANAVISMPVQVIGTVSDEHLASYEVLLTPTGKAEYQRLAQGTTSVLDGPLATLDPTLLMNGLYDLVLIATDASGQQASLSVPLKIEGDQKVGNFSFTVKDLEIPVSGIPILVTRTYDSRRRHEDLDFGYGWSIDYQNVKVEESRTLGTGWTMVTTRSGPFNSISTFCMLADGELEVAVTLPDGRVESFDVKAEQECNDFLPLLDVTLRFEPQQGTLSKLELASPLLVRLIGSDLVDLSAPDVPYDPNAYTLTTQEGYVYQLNQDFGITEVLDPNGNTLTYTSDGIFHSDGKSVLFHRNGEGRITALIDSAGNQRDYVYNSAGDLLDATDALGNTTQYTYNRSHGLLSIVDPLGNVPMRNIYNDEGRLIAQVDADGNRIDFNYDLVGQQSSVTDRLGRTTLLYYDARGNLTSQVDPLGNITTFTYDADDNLLSQTDPLGNTETATYDDRRNALTQTDAVGNTVAFTYNDLAQELTLSDARGNTFRNGYDSFGNLLTVIDPQENKSFQHIGFKGHVSKRTDALGHETHFTYDDEGNKLTETDPLGNISRWTYDTNGNQTSQTVTRVINGVSVDETTHFTYNANNQLTHTVDALGNTTRVEYNGLGEESARVDALGRRTSFTYDAYRRLIRTDYADNTTELRSYDAEGNLLTVTDRLGRTTQYEYDALDRQTRITYADGSQMDSVYDAAGRILAEIDENGNRSDHVYDGAGRRIQTTDPLGGITRFTYDADGNLLNQTDANGNAIQYENDSLDNRTKTTFADGSFQLDSVDKLGRLISKTDQAGKITQYDYDALGRLLTVTDALGQVTSYSYDEVGNQRTQTDAQGNTTRWTYDALGRRTSRTLPGGQTETYAYDAQGNLTDQTDFNGATTRYEYDLNDRLIKTSYADGAIETYTYDALGNRSSATDARGTITYTYDARDRLLSETQPDGTRLSYQYDAVGNRTQLTQTLPDHSQRITRYGFDGLNRLVQVTSPSNTVTTYAYDAAGNRVYVGYANGTYTNYSYDGLNRLTQLTTQDASGATLAEYRYTLGASGRRTQVTEHTGRIVDYTYDAIDRLTKEAINDPIDGLIENTYQYDAVGNRIYSIEAGVHTAYSYDANDRLLSQGGETHSYDANGNLIQTSIDAQVTTYTYDARNRLIGQTITNNGTTTQQTSYSYDIDGHRRSKLANGIQIHYVVDANRDYAQVLAELDDGHEPIVHYLYGDDLIEQNREGVKRTYHYDGLGSTRNLSDNSGTLSDWYHYDVYGQILSRSGNTENDYLFTGEQFDSSLNNYYLRARYYDPSAGRFTQMDVWSGKLCTPITLNKYIYADADPVNGIDPSGYFTMSGLMSGLGARFISSAGTSGFRMAGFSFARMKGKKTITKSVTCQIGAAYIKREYARDLVHGHHPINKSFGAPDDQVKIFLPANTHRMFHFVLHYVIKDEPAFKGMGNWTKAEKWDDITQTRHGRRLLYKKVLIASRVVDKFCGLRKPNNLFHFVQKNRKRFLGEFN